MDSEPRGLCLIFNIANFDKGAFPLEPRPGADKDTGQLCTFSSSIFTAKRKCIVQYTI